MKKILTLIITIVLFSCNFNKNKNSLITIEIEKNISNHKKLHLSEIADEVTYIPLETNQQCLIDRLNSIDIDEEYIFLSAPGKCLLFDLNGKFVSQIGSKGKGPGEYLFPGAVKIGKKVLFVPANNNLLIFNKSGELVKSIKNPSEFESIPFNNSWLPLSDSLFICHIRNTMGDEENKAVIFDLSSDTVQLIPNYIKFNRAKYSSRSDDGRSEFYTFKNEIYFKEFMNDTMFRVKENFFTEPSLVIQLGKYKFPDQYRSLPIQEYFKHVKEYIWITNFFETNNYFFLECHFGDHYPFKKIEYTRDGKTFMGVAPVLGIYSKVTGETYFVKPKLDDNLNPNGIANDYDGGLSFFPLARINDSTLLMSFSPHNLLTYLNSDTFKNSTPKYPKKKKELKQLATNLDWNDNPVLMLVKLKN